jgi:putative Ca2+/H+ antiporter (TMEM165/GDT1 family)
MLRGEDGARMDWKLIASTFGVVFLAELGDKTQIAALTLTASSRQPWNVFLGTSTALVIVSLIGIFAGAALADAVPLAVVRKISAAAFLLIGVAMLFDLI